LIEVLLRFRLAPLLRIADARIADAAIEKGQGAPRIEDERLTKICRSCREFALVTSASWAEEAFKSCIARPDIDHYRKQLRTVSTSIQSIGDSK
jgi:hypothetical protein